MPGAALGLPAGVSGRADGGLGVLGGIGELGGENSRLGAFLVLGARSELLVLAVLGLHEGEAVVDLLEGAQLVQDVRFVVEPILELERFRLRGPLLRPQPEVLLNL